MIASKLPDDGLRYRVDMEPEIQAETDILLLQSPTSLFLHNCPSHLDAYIRLISSWSWHLAIHRFDLADVRSLTEYFEDFELQVAGAHLSDAERIKYAH